MRWDGLFGDLEAQAEAIERVERAGEVDERTRGELATLEIRDRLRAATGLSLRLRLAGGATVTGTVMRVGPDWLLVDEGGGREAVLPTAPVLGIRGLARWSAVPDSAGVVESRLGLRHALRGIARDRSAVRIQLVDGVVVDGTLDRVGADFVELATHPAGEPRRRQDVQDVEVMPLAAIVSVRRAVA